MRVQIPHPLPDESMGKEKDASPATPPDRGDDGFEKTSVALVEIGGRKATAKLATSKWAKYDR